jgi:hypothetical protein
MLCKRIVCCSHRASCYSHHINQITHWMKCIRSYYKNRYMLQHRGAIIRGRTIIRHIDPKHEYSYYVAFPAVTKILNIKILKYLKSITIHLQCCKINSLESIKIKALQVLQFAALWITHTYLCRSYIEITSCKYIIIMNLRWLIKY